MKTNMDILMSTAWVYPFEYNVDGGTFRTTGMSLREHYSGLVMQGLAMANPSIHLGLNISVAEHTAAAAVRMADALIAELAKKPVD